VPLDPPPPIETARLLLRLVDESDLPALMSVNGDDEVTRFLPYATWRTLDDARAWLGRMRGFQDTGLSLQFVAADRRTGKAIGTLLIFRFEEANAQAELGFVLGRSYWGGGYMREALTALIGSAFATMGVRRLEAVADSRNAASVGLLRRLGFVREGVLRERWLEDGVPCDAEVFGLLRREWTAGPA